MLYYHMRKFRVICPGRTKEAFIREGIERYIRFLKPYAKVELVEVRSGRGSPREVIEKESVALLKAAGLKFFLFDRGGREFTSEEFAEFLRDLSQVDFVIGGVYGVSKELKERAGLLMSLSRLTFTHELSRLILFEQLYRAMTIIHGKGYHY